MLSNSNSLYSSFDDSSIKSVPDLQVEEQSFSDKEMNILPHSISYPNISIAMSPLQKTLSTWQNLENWLHRKQDIILKSDLISIKRHSFVLKGSSISFHEHSFLNIDANNSMENSSLGLHCSSLSLSQHSNSDDPSSSEDFITNLQELGLSFYFPFLHPFFFYLGWFLMLTNIVVIYINLLFKAARHSTSFNFTLLKGIIISSVSSMLFITPFIIFLISVPWSIYFYNQNQKFSNNDDISLSTKKKDLHKIDYYSSSYRRIEYFKKYLRPPKEAILEQFRQVAVHEKIILNFYRNIWMHVSLLILLLGAAMSKDVQMKYLQRNSIENSLFQSLHLHIHWIPSKHMLLNWIELDFMDKFISEQRCLPIDKDCGISTQCILVGNVILRHFYNISTLSSYSNETKNMNFGEMYERRHLKGYYSSYFVEDEWEALTDDNFYTYDQMQTFVNKLKTSSAASIEMLLFNPTFQDYISVSILFEKAQAEAIAFSYEIFSFTLYSRLYYPKVFLNSMLFICVLFSCKNQLWKMLKQGHLYWRYLTNYFNCFFIIMCFIYLAFFVLYIHICKRISFRLIKTQLNSNINITELLFVETCVNVLSGLLVFMHLYKFLRVFCFNPRLERIYKRLIHSQKLILSTFLSFIIIAFASCALLNLTGTNFILSYPLYSFIKGINLSLKNYSKTEIKVIQGVFQNALAVFAAILVIFIHFYTFTVIKSILLNTKCSYVNMKNSNITLKQMSQVLKKKLSQYFRSETPQIISQENHVPPIEILLLELEKLTDTLVSKAENMFPERTVSLNQIDLESDFHSQKVHPVRISKMKFELNDLNKHNWQEKLMLTIPHSCKKEHNAILPISLQSSLKLGKTLNIFESPSVLQSNRIRRTYPLCYFNPNSSESEFHSETTEQEEALFDNSLLIRRTKSRGKFNGNFDCSYENLNQELEYSSSIQE